MKQYELTLLISSKLDEKESFEVSKKISGLITELSGSIKTKSDPEMKQLGYAINDRMEAFLVSIVFSIEAEKTNELKKKIEEEKNILRYILLIKKDQIEKTRRRKEVSKEEQKVDIEQIDEKIDEILS